MLDVETLSEELRKLAERAADNPARLSELRRRTAPRRRAHARARVIPVLAVIALVTVMSLGGWYLQRGFDRGGFSAATSWSQWPARGDEAANPRALELAKRAWDAGVVGDSPVVHSDVRVLYLGHARVVGYVGVLAGVDPSGKRRLAFLTGPVLGPDQSATSPDAFGLVLRAEMAAPAEAVSAVSFLSRRFPATATRNKDPWLLAPTSLPDRAVAVVLAAPGGAVEPLTSPAWDTYSNGDATPDLFVEDLPAPATLSNTTVTVRFSSGKRTTSIQTVGIADPPQPVGGVVAGYEVLWLPAGFRPQSSSDTGAVYQDQAGRTITLDVRTGKATRVGEETTAHGGKPAVFIRQAHDSTTLTWQDAPDTVLTLTGSAGVKDIMLYDVSQALNPVR